MNKESQFKLAVLDMAKDCNQTPEQLIEALENLHADSVAPYYSQISELYETYEDILWQMYCEEWQEHGSDLSPLQGLDEMHARYHGVPSCHIEDLMTIKQWLVWYCIESTAHKIARELEEEAA